MTNRFLSPACLLLPLLALTRAEAGPLTYSPAKLAHVVLTDQKQIVTSPARLRTKDWKWLAPLAGTAAILIATDDRNMRERIHGRSGLNVSRFGTASLVAIPAWLYLRGGGESRTTAVLTGRAVLDTLIISQALHLATTRDTFPSDHAALSWAAASVIAERYPGWLTKVGVYGLASAVTISRVTARKHNPSEVLLGSALGFGIGKLLSYVPKQQHFNDSENPAPAGSTYVPMDSWIYPALDRLAAQGLIPTQIQTIRPWTREECLRQLKEAESRLTESNVSPDLQSLLSSLEKEFSSAPPQSPRRLGGESRPAVVLESLYQSSTELTGPILNDSFQTGQTIRNDYGRPNARGFNTQTGFTVRAERGRYFAWTQAEYQHAPSNEPDRFRTIQAYAGLRLANLQFSLGKQELYWGPTYDAPLSFSMNAEPTKNLKISTVHPFQFNGPLGYLGQIRGEFAIGKLGGHRETWRPWFNAQKLSFKLTENLEMGFTRWSIFWGVGHPITLRSLARNLISIRSSNGDSYSPNDPGDRKGGFDFRYRLPGLRNWLTLYSDSYSDDDPSPLAAPRRAAINPGLHLTRFPGLPKLDLRLEAPSTMPMNGDYGGNFIYYNGQYQSGNTNYGVLLGNPVGRDGRALQAWSTYWFSARNKLEFGIRHQKIGSQFLPGGGTQTDGTIKAHFDLPKACRAEFALQRERYLIPTLAPTARTNTGATLKLIWEPNLPLVN